MKPRVESRLHEVTEEIRQNPGKLYSLVYGDTIIDMVKRTNTQIINQNIAFNLTFYQNGFVELVSTVEIQDSRFRAQISKWCRGVCPNFMCSDVIWRPVERVFDQRRQQSKFFQFEVSLLQKMPNSRLCAQISS